ncbi:MAG: hypothetical protein A3E87_10585 [Gammaproteobacteria bacterium RIFCSPHIGHO2_12_FULL_35_23]|nr:MAG: hypothetical protein A3E87_10585 [Gammaproteobacteria bacterium RIFCSPHIGHO2_12_FULL_35_23]
MKKRVIVISSLVLGLLCGCSLADSIGIVDVKAVFASSNAVQAQRTKLQADFSAKHQKLVDMQKTLEGLIDQYKRNETVMSASQKQQLQTQISAQQNQIYQLGQMYAQQAEAAQDQAMQVFLTNLQAATAKVAQAKNLTLVLPASTIIYSTQTDDITAAVEKQINS